MIIHYEPSICDLAIILHQGKYLIVECDFGEDMTVDSLPREMECCPKVGFDELNHAMDFAEEKFQDKHVFVHRKLVDAYSNER